VTNPRTARPFPRRAVAPRAILCRAGGGTLVVVAPHPDDETLGAGSLIAAAVRAGIRVAVVALTDGGASHTSVRWPPAALGRLRRGELRRALARLGAGRAAVRHLGWPDGGVDHAGRALALRAVLTALAPAIVIAASPADHHPDHRAGWRLTVAALAGTRVPLIAYAVWSRAGGGRAAHGPIAAKLWAARAHRSQTSGYIADDPDGFRLTPALLRTFVRGAEAFAR